MHLYLPIRIRLIPLLITFVMTSGCQNRVVEVAREASDRQAAQNRQMADLQQAVARGTHELVKADAATRLEVVAVHRDLQHERQQLSESWTDLEVERRRIDDERRSDVSRRGIIAAILGAMLLIAYFGFLWQLLARAGSNEPSQEEFSELLLEHFLPVVPSEPIESRLPEGRGANLAVLTTDGAPTQFKFPPHERTLP
jgi:hypothetical protein